MQKTYDTVVIGAGIAGITAAIYLKRSNIDVLLIDKNAPGGLLNKISSIENYPGYIKISGPELAEKLFEQVNKLNIEYHYGNALTITEENNIKIIKTDQEEIKTKTIILALGRTPNKLNIKNEEKLLNKGISYCALCDGPLFKNKEVAVVGSGNSAAEEALYLSKICKNVTLIVRNEKLKAESTILEKIKNESNINIKYNTIITKILEEENKLKGLEINNKEMLKVDGLFIYIGLKPNNEFIKNLELETNKDYIIVDKNMRTSKQGIYAVGDVIKKDVYQLTTATSDATIAAISVKKDLE